MKIVDNMLTTPESKDGLGRSVPQLAWMAQPRKNSYLTIVDNMDNAIP
ncbi:MAG TPA: hypothetical protein VEI25_10295 [Paraburkholderia sp.]|nr:hypothetical protein [Paraburkholderia sp.]